MCPCFDYCEVYCGLTVVQDSQAFTNRQTTRASTQSLPDCHPCLEENLVPRAWHWEQDVQPQQQGSDGTGNGIPGEVPGL